METLKYFLLSILLLPNLTVGQVSQEWINIYGSASTNYIDEVKDIATDNNGNVYITGKSLSTTSNTTDVLIIKYDGQGNQVWLKEHHAFGIDKGKCIGVDKANNIYVAGISENTNGDEDALLLKYNTNGNLIWSRTFDVAGMNEEIRGMKIDKNANIYLTGFTEEINLYTNMLTLKYDSAGTLNWSAIYNDPIGGHDHAYAIALGNNGDVFVTGESVKVIAPEDVALTTIKYDANGNQVWEHNFQGVANDYDYSRAIIVDSLGYAYVGGGTVQATFPTDVDFLTIKYDLNGDTIWTRTYSGLTASGNDGIVDIELDENLCIIVSGNSDGANSQDIATIQYDNNGNINWVVREDTGQYTDIVADIEIDDSNKIYIASAYLIKYDEFGNEIWRILMDTTSLYPNPTCLTLSEDACNLYLGADGMFQLPNTLWTADAVAIKYKQCTPSPTVEVSPIHTSSNLLQIVDILGRETIPQKNVPLFYRYDDGRVEKKLIME